MQFLIYMAWSVFFSVVARAFAPSSKPPAPEKATLADVDAPTIDEGLAVAIFAGTVKLDGQNVSWFGGLSANPVTQQGVVTGYKYKLTTQLTFGFGPIDGIKEIRFEDNALSADQVTYTSTTDYIDAAINAPSLFGGDDKEGGVSGTIRFYKGTTTQTHNIESATLIGKVTPAYRRVFYAVARNFYWGLSPRLKPLSIVVQRWPNQLNMVNNEHKIGEDANPVCFLYEIMTDPVWGAGEPVDRFDVGAWRAAAKQAHAEGIGISLRFAASDSVERVIQALMKYVDGAIYEDPITGLYSLRLIRDMVDADFPVLDKTHVTQVSASRISWTELKNTVKVTFTDRSRNYETGGVQAQQSAALASVGNITDMETAELPGFHNGDAAAFAAKRMLRSLSYPLSKVRVVGDRALAALRPGMGFVLQWERPTLNATYRVNSIDFGTLDSPEVTIEAVEDAFSTESNTFVVPPRSTWAPVDSLARPVTEARLIEQPYRWTLADTRSALYAAEAPSAAHLTYRLVSAGAVETTAYNFASTSRLQAALPLWSENSVLTLPMTLPAGFANPTQADYDAGQAVLLIGDELLAYRAAVNNGDGTVTFGPLTRGVLDTVPAGHAVGSVVWLLSSVGSRLPLALTADQAVAVGSLTATQSDDQVLGEETTLTLTTNSRALRPLAPRTVSVNGSLFGEAFAETQAPMPLTVTWVPRSRLATTLDAVGNEPGTTYTVTARDAASGALLSSQTIDGTSATINVTAPSGRVQVSVAALRDGLASWATQGVNLAVGEGTATATTAALLHFDGVEGATTTTDEQGNTVLALAALGVDDGGALRAAGAKLGPTGASGGWAVQVPTTVVTATGDWMSEAWFISSASEPAVLLSGFESSGVQYAVATTSTEVQLIDLADFTRLASASGFPYGTQVHVLLQRRGDVISVAVGGVEVISWTDSGAGSMSAVAWYVNIATSALTAGTAVNPSPNYVDEFRVAVGGSRQLPFTP